MLIQALLGRLGEAVLEGTICRATGTRISCAFPAMEQLVRAATYTRHHDCSYYYNGYFLKHVYNMQMGQSANGQFARQHTSVAT